MVKEQDFCLGMILQILDPDVTEALAISGLDYIVLDLEHTGKTIESAYPCIMAAYAYNVPVLVRCADKDKHMIEQALDAGAQGVFVPTIETVEEARDVVKAAKFAPMGERGFCPMDATTRWMNHVDEDPLVFANDANRDTFVAIMIETPKGMENLPEILKVDGIDAIHLGPGDYGMRVGKHIWSPEVQKVMLDATEMISKAGKLCIPVTTPDLFEEQFKNGAKLGIYGESVATMIKKNLMGARKEMLEIASKCV